MSSQLSRRDFLKLLSILPLLQFKIPDFGVEPRLANQQPGLPNFLVLVFDALSASHMSLYGYPRDTTPNLKRFAQKATVYHSHYAGGSFTSPGTSSILTGTYPWTHRAFHLHSTAVDRFKDNNLFSLLGQKGYHRIAYTHNHLVSSLLFHFRQHLDVYLKTRELSLVDDQFSDLAFTKDTNTAFLSEWLLMRGGSHPSSLFLSFLHRAYRYLHKREFTKEYGALFPRGIPNLHNMFFILEDTVDWLNTQLITLPRPYLAYIHVLPPHEPFTTRREFIDIFRDGWKPPAKPVQYFDQGLSEDNLNINRREYDEYIAYTDAEFGRLYDRLQSNGELENTYFVVTSDHGKLFERGILGHVTPALYRPLIRVPLIISKPGQRSPQEVYSLTNSVDLLPTLLQVTGIPIPDWVEGKPLPTFGDEYVDPGRAVYTVEAKSNPKLAPLRKASVALVKGDYKLTQYFGYGEEESIYELFDLTNDPEELDNLVKTKSSLVSDFRHELEAKIREVNQPYLS